MKKKKIPYGIHHLDTILNDGYYYIDKTHFIETLENLSEKFVSLFRPRKFGKSLFLNTLKLNYDINEKENFNKYFGDLYIGKNPTDLANSYYCFKFDFSGFESKNFEFLEDSFKETVIFYINSFCDEYNLKGFKTDSSKPASTILKGFSTFFPQQNNNKNAVL